MFYSNKNLGKSNRIAEILTDIAYAVEANGLKCKGSEEMKERKKLEEKLEH